MNKATYTVPGGTAIEAKDGVQRIKTLDKAIPNSTSTEV